MNGVEARELLRFHGTNHPDIDDPRWTNGFLGSLRPYRGLRIENFHEVMACVRALAPELQQAAVDREVVSALWGICHFGRAWGVWPEGMLRRNDLITIEDSTTLERWIDCISEVTTMLLDGHTVESTFHAYDTARPGLPSR